MDGRGLKFTLEKRQQLFADSCAGPRQIQIRGIFAPGLLLVSQVFAQVGAANLQERSNDRSGDRVDRTEAAGAGSAQQMSEHCFRLIVSGVSDRDAREAAGLYRVTKKLVPRAPRDLFEIASFFPRFRCNILSACLKFKSVG